MQSISHGLVSLFLFLMAIAIAIGAVFVKSPLFGTGYLVIVLLCFLNILASYCAKCPCRLTECSHVIPGKLAAFLPKRKEGPYSPFDIVATIISFSAIILIPQLWLFHNIPSLVLFWLFVIIGGFEAVFLTCPDCENKYCFLNASKNKNAK